MVRKIELNDYFSASKRYIELNDYNRSLFEVLKSAAYIELIEVAFHVFGFVPLNSSNVFIWRFKD